MERRVVKKPVVASANKKSQTNL